MQFGPEFWKRPGFRHEVLLRLDFQKSTPLSGSRGNGLNVFKALSSAATLSNGGCYIQWRMVCGVVMRCLCMGRDWPKESMLSPYGGVLSDGDMRGATHTRSIPGSAKMVMVGQPFADTFSSIPVLGQREIPTSADEALNHLVTTTGIGYMANAPSSGCQCGRGGPNAQICAIPMGRSRRVKDVPLDAALFVQPLRDLYKDEEVICSYGTGNPQYEFWCHCCA